MADTIGQLHTIISADSKPFEKGINRAKRSSASFQKQSTELTGTLTKLGGALVATAGVAGFGALARSALEAADQLGKTASKLGETSAELAKLQFAGQQSGVAITTMNMALQRMVRRVSEAAKGTGEAKDAIKELGLDAKRLNQQSPAEIFTDIARAMARVPSQADKVRLAMRLFDSEGVALVNTLDLGVDAIKALGDEAEQLGLALETQTVRQAEAASDATNRLRRSVEAATQVLVSGFADVIVLVANTITEMVKTIRSLIQWVDALTGGFASLAIKIGLGISVLAGLAAALQKAGTWIVSTTGSLLKELTAINQNSLAVQKNTQAWIANSAVKRSVSLSLPVIGAFNAGEQYRNARYGAIGGKLPFGAHKGSITSGDSAKVNYYLKNQQHRLQTLYGGFGQTLQYAKDYPSLSTLFGPELTQTYTTATGKMTKQTSALGNAWKATASAARKGTAVMLSGVRALAGSFIGISVGIYAGIEALKQWYLLLSGQKEQSIGFRYAEQIGGFFGIVDGQQIAENERAWQQHLKNVQEVTEKEKAAAAVVAERNEKIKELDDTLNGINASIRSQFDGLFDNANELKAIEEIYKAYEKAGVGRSIQSNARDNEIANTRALFADLNEAKKNKGLETTVKELITEAQNLGKTDFEQTLSKLQSAYDSASTQQQKQYFGQLILNYKNAKNAVDRYNESIEEGKKKEKEREDALSSAGSKYADLQRLLESKTRGGAAGAFQIGSLEAYQQERAASTGAMNLEKLQREQNILTKDIKELMRENNIDNKELAKHLKQDVVTLP